MATTEGWNFCEMSDLFCLAPYQRWIFAVWEKGSKKHLKGDLAGSFDMIASASACREQRV